MKTTNYILDKGIFATVWLAIAVISTGLVKLFFAAVKSALGA